MTEVRTEMSLFNRGLTATTIGMILFSTGPVLVAGSEVGGLAAAFWRACIGAATALAIATARGNLPSRTLRLTAVPGIAFGLGIGLFFSAAQLTSVANTALITVLQPLPIMVGGSIFFAERIRRPDVGWSALAILGAAFMILSANSAGTSHLGGDLMAAASTLAGSAYFLAGKRARLEIDTLPFMAGLFSWGAVALAPMMLVSGQEMWGYAGLEWVRIVALAALPGIGHVLINYSHGKIPLAVMGVLHLLIPVCSALLALWFLGQTIAVGQIVGMIVVALAMSAHGRYRALRERDDPSP